MTAISVIIPAHNAAATVARTLASLAPEAEIIG
ncbi:glycosyltransferase family 2 protein, partial [Mesorhizobium sp. M2E.F.Ca.ET.166.01.1.1]